MSNYTSAGGAGLGLPGNVAADAYLAAILNLSNDGLIGRDLDGCIVSWNEAAERIFGYEAEEAIGEAMEILIRAERAEEEARILEAVRRGEKVTGFETVRVRKDGSVVDVSIAVTPIEDQSGTVSGALYVVHDLSGPKRAAESAARLRLAIESAPNGMVMINQEGIITMVNSQMERLFGYGREEMLGQRIEIFLPERYRRSHPDQRRGFFQFPEARAMGRGRDLYARRKDGTEMPVEIGLNPAETPEGKFVLAAIIDITARKQAEAAAAKAGAQLRMEAAPNGMVMVNEQGIILMVNAQMERLFGYDRAEMLGQPIEILLPDRFRASHPGQREIFCDTPEVRMMGHGRDLYGRRKDGSEFPVEVGLNPAESGEGVRVLAAVIDITQRKRMEEELAKVHADLTDHVRNLELTVTERTAHLQRTIAELEGVSYSLSHDLRAPLRTIQGFSQIVLANAGDRLESQERELLKKNISAANRMDRLIQDVLTYTQISRQTMSMEVVPVERLLRQIIDERPEFQAPTAEITLCTPFPPVLGHEASLTQCITNLLDNAVKFVPLGRQPQVTVRGEAIAGRVQLWFEDNGIGIPKEAQDRVFGIFQRMHDEKTYPGTGIGLAIVRNAVQRMRGEIWIESEPDQGSRFCLQLPAAP